MSHDPDEPNSAVESFWRIIGQLRGQRRLIAMTFVILGTLFVCIAAVVPRNFTAEAVMVVDARRNPLFESSNPLIPLQADTNAINSEVTLVQVADTLARVVDRLKLTNDPRYVGSSDNAPQASALRLDDTLHRMKKFTGVEGIWPSAGSVGTAVPAERVRQARAMRVLSDGLRVVNDPRTYTLRVRYTSRDPVHAAQVANAIADAYVEAQRDSRVQGLRARVVSNALIPVQPSGMSRTALTIIAVIGAGLFALALGLIAGKLRRTFRSAFEAETKLRLPVIATVPKLGRKQLKSAALLDAREELAGRAGLELAAPLLTASETSNVVLITSAKRREGKSTVALLLSAAIARAGRRCLLADGAVDDRSGFSVKLASSSTAEPTQATEKSGAELLLTQLRNLTLLKWNEPDQFVGGGTREQRLVDALPYLREQFDHIVIDAPSVLESAEARYLAAASDHVYLVIEWDATPPEAAMRAAEIIERLDRRPKLVLAQIDPGRMSRRERGYLEAFA